MSKPLAKLPLRKIYGDICRGYSVGKWSGHEVYIKHLGNVDHSNVEDYTEEQLEKARKLGVPTREEKEKWLMETNQWSKKQDMEILQQKSYIDGLKDTRATARFEAQLAQMNATIAEEQKRYDSLTAKKEALFGYTADRYAAEKVQFYYIYLSFFRDPEFKQRFFIMEELTEMDEEESYELLSFYIEIINDFTLDIIKRVSISPSFVNALSLCGEDLTSFFAVPVWQLSIYQSNLVGLGSYFRSIMAGENIPIDIRDNPEKIEEFVVKAKNVKEMMAKTAKDGSSMGVFGASQKDFENNGMKDDRSFLKGGDTSLLSTLKAVV